MRSANVVVTDTATLLVAADNQNRHIYIHVVGNQPVALGNASVTYATGLLTEKHTSPFEVFLPLGESIYAIADTGVTENVRIMTPNLD